MDPATHAAMDPQRGLTDGGGGASFSVHGSFSDAVAGGEDGAVFVERRESR